MQYNRFQTLSDIFILIGLLIIGSVVSASLFALVSMPFIKLGFFEIMSLAKTNTDPQMIPYLKLFTTFTAAGSWVFSSWVLLRIKKQNPMQQWQFRKPSPKQVLLYLPFLFLALMYASAFLLKVNASLPLPESIKNFTSVENKKLMGTFLHMASMNDFLVNLVLIALAPAVFEELFFRGTLQGMLIELFGSAHVGIIVCSFVFAAIHLNAEQFIPMFFLALVLGYVCYYSRSIWPSIILHFLNNGFAVWVTYLQDRMPVAKAIATDDYTPPIAATVLAFAVIGGFFYWLIKKNQTLNTITYE
jgi:membrane protease YdiL (CAAX protease family)